MPKSADKPFLRRSTDGLNRQVSDSFALDFAGDPGRTQQNFGKECDINTIFAKYRATGLVRVPSRARDPIFADLPSSSDLHSALNLTISSQRKFDQLPADLRKRFDNDYTKMFSYLSDPSKLEESYSIGLRVKPPAKAGPTEVPTGAGAPRVDASGSPALEAPQGPAGAPGAQAKPA